MTSTVSAHREDLAALARMLRLLGRTSASNSGQGLPAPEPAAVLERMTQSLAFVRHCTDNAQQHRNTETATSPVTSAVVTAYAAAAMHAATVNRHLAAAFDLAVAYTQSETPARRSSAEALQRQRQQTAIAALAAAQKEADRGHEHLLVLSARLSLPPAAEPAAAPTAPAAKAPARSSR